MHDKNIFRDFFLVGVEGGALIGHSNLMKIRELILHWLVDLGIIAV